ncbi:hypothetical protein [uncultured Mucilaginibacter sp.]|uniref:hypothetical protein n=1 Tax=uncultured Mucilaginibacter sp. TaxID=797541 RepID=UPI00261BBE46|nr:hypothetical protein [uncultured Mucilaginibacter sp.]
MNSLVFRVFRAIDEPEACLRFIEGHRKVLEIYGITMITSNKALWMNHKNTYVILVESVEDGKVVGGARVQIADDDLPLPIIDAVKQIDIRIYDIVDEYKYNFIAELCGLWNSREIAGYGIGSNFLIRNGIALARILRLKTMIALCAPATVKMCSKSGFVIERSLGNDGFFNYPKLDLIATAMIIKDINNLETATEESRDFINDLCYKRIMHNIEKGPKGEIRVEYNLILKM